MKKLVPLLQLLQEFGDRSSVRKIHYVPDEKCISFDFSQTGCSDPSKDIQKARTELNHEWYPFLVKDTTGADEIHLVPDTVPKFDLTLEGWSGYFSQLAILTQCSNCLYTNSSLRSLGVSLTPAVLRALDRIGLLDLIAYDKSVWVSTYARPDKAAKKLRLLGMVRLSDKETKEFEMYDLECGRAYMHTAGVLPIIRVPSNILVDEREFRDGGMQLQLILPK